MKEVFTNTANENGSGKTLFAWSPRGHFLATNGPSRKVTIVDRAGNLECEFHVPAGEQKEASSPSCKQMAWDANERHLAVIPQNSDTVLIYNLSSKEASNLQSSIQDPTCIAWAKKGEMLGVGTQKGLVVLHHASQKKETPIRGLHTRAIVSAAWSVRNDLITVSEDKNMSVLGSDSSLKMTQTLRSEPNEIRIGAMRDEHARRDAMQSKDTTVTVNLGKNGLWLYRIYNPQEGEKAKEIKFDTKYGKLVQHEWFGDGYILLAFSEGYVVTLATHDLTMNQVVATKHLFSSEGRSGTSIKRFSVCHPQSMAAVVGQTDLKLVQIAGGKLREPEGNNITYSANMSSVEYTSDGQILTFGCDNGDVVTLLASIPQLSDVHGTTIGYLTSLKEVTLYDVKTKLEASVEVSIEPSFIACGDRTIAVGMNNQAVFYVLDDASSQARKINERFYLGSVTTLCCNDRVAAALTGGKVYVHSPAATEEDDGSEEDRILPPSNQEGDVTCLAMTDRFLIYGNKRGWIVYVQLDGLVTVNSYRHESGEIHRVFPSRYGTRLAFVDGAYKTYILNPVNDQVLQVPDYTGVPETVIWDQEDRSTCVLVDENELHVYSYASETIDGPQITLISDENRKLGYSPIALFQGVMMFQNAEGEMRKATLGTHKVLEHADEGPLESHEAKVTRRFSHALKLKRFELAWSLASGWKNSSMLLELASAALYHLETSIALRAFRQVERGGIVLSFEDLHEVEDKNLLAGYIHALKDTSDFDKRQDGYDKAQDYFLKSSRPLEALDLRKDLKHWDEAMNLAKKLDATQVPRISKEYGQSLEMRKEYESALKAFEEALSQGELDHDSEFVCQAGTARISLHLGDIRKGKQLALESGSKELCNECAQILEEKGHAQDAAELYEQGDNPEKAASIYIKIKHYASAQPLMNKISSPQLHIEYAKAKENEGRYQEAKNAFEAAEDMDDVARLCIERLNAPQKAFAIVRKTKSKEVASMIAKYCTERGDNKSAMEFLVIAGRKPEAEAMARAKNALEEYASVLGDQGTPEEYNKLSNEFESALNYARAGDMAAKAKDYKRAVRLYKRCGKSRLEEAIDIVGKANDDALESELFDHLHGQYDGQQKDPKYIFKLHMALGNYEQAARTAVVVANQERQRGNYASAHLHLYQGYKELLDKRMHIPHELASQLVLLHSYVLAKIYVKAEEHSLAAALLQRVGSSISSFPAHTVPILTSCVVECQRAGFKKASHEFASQLMQPEYRELIREDMKKKIEQVVRRPPKGEDTQPHLLQCPFCQTPGPEMELQCHNCKNYIPFCAGSGRRMTLDEWAATPCCNFQCRYTDYVHVVQMHKECPMCGERPRLEDVRKIEPALVADWQGRFQGSDARDEADAGSQEEETPM